MRRFRVSTLVKASYKYSMFNGMFYSWVKWQKRKLKLLTDFVSKTGVQKLQAAFIFYLSNNVLQNYRTVDMNGGSLSHSDWHNLYETVFQEHRGEKEYTDKLEEQITLFQVNVFSIIWS